jgi:hypothetical protein
MGQPQPGRARAAPAAHSRRLGTSVPDATTVSPGPAANRSPRGRGRREPHTRAVWAHRCHPPTPHRQDQLPAAAREGAGGASRTLAPSGSIVVTRQHRDGRGGARTRLSRGATSAACLVRGRRETMRSSGASVRLAPPAPSRAAAGRWSCRCGGGGWQRRTPKACVCGWRRPRPAGLRLVHGAPALSSAAVFSHHHKLHAPSPVASHDAQVREGPGAAVRSEPSSIVHECAALGPGAALCSRGVVMGARWCSDGRARSWTRT